jgi:hypothetical protein
MNIGGLKELLPLLIPLVLLQLGLMAAALVDLSRRERVRGGNKLIFGPLAYFLFGRED